MSDWCCKVCDNQDCLRRVEGSPRCIINDRFWGNSRLKEPDTKVDSVPLVGRDGWIGDDD